jgi:hypothetical protein
MLIEQFNARASSSRIPSKHAILLCLLQFSSHKCLVVMSYVCATCVIQLIGPDDVAFPPYLNKLLPTQRLAKTLTKSLAQRFHVKARRRDDGTYIFDTPMLLNANTKMFLSLRHDMLIMLLLISSIPRRCTA